jgi:uncharacterized protein YcbX
MAPGMPPLDISLELPPEHYERVNLNVCGDRYNFFARYLRLICNYSCVGLVYSKNINNWFSRFIGVSCSLVRLPIEAGTPTCLSQEYRISGARQLRSAQRRKQQAPSLASHVATPSTQTAQQCTISYSNESQFLIVCTASVKYLQNLMYSDLQLPSANRDSVGGKDILVGVDSFRPNLVIRTTTPFEEDTWRSLTVDNNHFEV